WFRRRIVSATITKPKAIRKKTSDAMSTRANACSRIFAKMDGGRGTSETKSGGRCVIIGAMRRIAQYLFVAFLAMGGCQKQAISTSEFAAERQKMVEQQLQPRGIHDQRVLTAMAKVPREEFVPGKLRGQAYTDNALPIGHDQTISQPFIVAIMTE